MKTGELCQTVQTILNNNRGILACDESPGTMGKRFENRKENSKSNRDDIRRKFFSSAKLEQFIGGVILHSETLETPAVLEPLLEKGIILGIKTDKGLAPLAGGKEGEETTKGLDSLEADSKKFYELGARFAKWRSVLHICEKSGMPSDKSYDDVSEVLSEYAIISQKCGLVPIIEPEVLQNGPHSIDKGLEVTKKIIKMTLDKSAAKGVCMPGALLKVNMVTRGVDNEVGVSRDTKHDCDKVAKCTVEALHDGIGQHKIGGVVFLSGGLSEQDSATFLNRINEEKRTRQVLNLVPLHFSFARALQKSAITLYCVDAAVEKVQECLVHRCQMNHLATKCQYDAAKLEGDYGDASKGDNFVKDNNY
ncbi:MAG: hypothetical protein MHMPM18_002085 [Marteilia pararefringens]